MTVKLNILVDQTSGSKVKKYMKISRALASKYEGTKIYTFTNKIRERELATINRLDSLKNEKRATIDVVTNLIKTMNKELDEYPDHIVILVFTDHADNSSAGSADYIADHVYAWGWKVWVSGKGRESVREEMGLPDYYSVKDDEKVILRMLSDLESYGSAGSYEGER